MVEGPDRVFICVECVRLCADVADANAATSLPSNLDPSKWHDAHMILVCYVRTHQGEDGVWMATALPPLQISARGDTAKDAVHRVQAELLGSAAKALAEGKQVGPHFTNQWEGLA